MTGRSANKWKNEFWRPVSRMLIHGNTACGRADCWNISDRIR